MPAAADKDTMHPHLRRRLVLVLSLLLLGCASRQVEDPTEVPAAVEYEASLTGL